MVSTNLSICKATHLHSLPICSEKCTPLHQASLTTAYLHAYCLWLTILSALSSWIHGIASLRLKFQEATSEVVHFNSRAGSPLPIFRYGEDQLANTDSFSMFGHALHSQWQHGCSS
eukprot:1032892-Pelagomonas_calceolata.AAC.2